MKFCNYYVASILNNDLSALTISQEIGVVKLFSEKKKKKKTDKLRN